NTLISLTSGEAPPTKRYVLFPETSFSQSYYIPINCFLRNQRKVDVEGFLSAQAAIDAIKGSMDLYAANIKAGLQR
ncbi:BnaAnng38200D, partial [Brassica napus]